MARTDNLSHFLSDVADAIRTKKGSSDTIQASDFDTEIENLPSGGGTTPTQVSELSNAIIDNVLDGFNDYLLSYPDTYEVGSSQTVILHTPNINCQYYGIQKRSSGNYRAFWTTNAILGITDSSTTRINWRGVGSSSNIFINTTVLTFVVQSDGTSQNNQYYYATTEQTTPEECLQKLINNELSYNSYSGASLGCVPDTPLAFPYSNITLIDIRTGNNYVLLPSKRISSNEIIQL